MNTLLVLIGSMILGYILGYIVSKSKDVLQTQENGCVSPLHIAAYKGDAPEVLRLIESGADVNVRDIAGDTPLAYALRAERSASKLLIHDPKLDIMSKGDDGHSYFYLSAFYGYSHALEELKELLPLNVCLESIDELIEITQVKGFEKITFYLKTFRDENKDG